jgi:hypothetical protein
MRCDGYFRVRWSVYESRLDSLLGGMVLDRLRKKVSLRARTPAAEQFAEKVALQSEEEPQRLKPD